MQCIVYLLVFISAIVLHVNLAIIVVIHYLACTNQFADHIDGLAGDEENSSTW